MKKIEGCSWCRLVGNGYRILWNGRWLRASAIQELLGVSRSKLNNMIYSNRDAPSAEDVLRPGPDRQMVSVLPWLKKEIRGCLQVYYVRDLDGEFRSLSRLAKKYRLCRRLLYLRVTRKEAKEVSSITEDLFRPPEKPRRGNNLPEIEESMIAGVSQLPRRGVISELIMCHGSITMALSSVL